MNATNLCPGLCAALLLAACGGGGGGAASDIAGADTSETADTATDTTADTTADTTTADSAAPGCGVAAPAGALCNPYPACTTGCGAGETCTNVNAGGGENVVCQAGGVAAAGAACDHQAGPFCADGACVRNECRQFCDQDGDCANGTDCRPYLSGSLRVNVCGASEAIICDPFQPEVECAAGTSCYRDVVAAVSSCLATGAAAYGESCSCPECCASGLTCARDDAGATGTCGQGCVTGGAGERGCATRCAGAVTWQPQHDANSVAFCVPFESYPITAVTPAAAVNGELTHVGEYDVFSFEGTAGQVVRVSLTTPGGAFDPLAIDAIVSLHTADDGALVAIADDNVFADALDSTVVTVLPKTGTYYALVRDCWTYVAERPDKEFGCYAPVVKTAKSYALRVADVTAATVVDTETGDAAADAVALPVSGGAPTLARGTFRDAADVDVFAVTVPTNLPLAGTGGHAFRARLWIRSFAGGVSGPYGSGSTTALGELRLTTAADPDTVIARVAAVDRDQVVQIPVAPGQVYLLWVTPAAGAAPTGDRDFYLLAALPDRSLPVEAPAHNDDVASAELPTDVYRDDTDTYYQIAGDIAPTAGDVDHYAFAVAAPQRKVRVACWAASIGSGVEGLLITLLAEDGAPLPNGVGIDSHASPAVIAGVTLPTTATKFVLKVAASGQAADVAATHYDCQVVVSAP